MALDRKINLGLGLQVALEAIRMLERMELETMAVILIGLLITPFILGSLWSLGITVMWQLISLGFKAGIMLFTVCSLYLSCLKFKSAFNLKKGMTSGEIFEGFGKPTKEESRPKCTLMDLVLSVFYQTGLRLPSFVWDPLMELCLRRAKNVEDQKMRREMQLPQLMDADPQSLTQAVQFGLMSSPIGNYLPGRMFTPMNVDLTITGTRFPFTSHVSEEDADTDTGSVERMENDDVFVFDTRSEDSATDVPATKSTRRRRSGLRAQAQKRKSVRIAPKH